MKITEKRLKQILKEELAAIKERQSYTDDQLRLMALADPDFEIDTDPFDDGMRRAADAKRQIRNWAEKKGLVKPQGPSPEAIKDRKVQAIRAQAMKLEKDGNWRGALNLLDKGIKEVGDIFGRPLVMLQKDLRAEYADQVMREETIEEVRPFGEDPKDRKPQVDPWATAHKRGGPGGSVHRAGPAKLGPERPMTPKSAEQHAKDIENGSREYDATRRLPEEISEMFGASDVGSFDDQKEKLTRIIKNYLKTIYQEYMDDMRDDPTSHEENKRAAMSAAKGDLAAEIDEIIKDVNSFLGEARRKRETPAQKRRRSEEERRNAELRSQGKPEWQSGQPGVTTTSSKDLKKMMQND